MIADSRGAGHELARSGRRGRSSSVTSRDSDGPRRGDPTLAWQCFIPETGARRTGHAPRPAQSPGRRGGPSMARRPSALIPRLGFLPNKRHQRPRDCSKRAQTRHSLRSIRMTASADDATAPRPKPAYHPPPGLDLKSRTKRAYVSYKTRRGSAQNTDAIPTFYRYDADRGFSWLTKGLPSIRADLSVAFDFRGNLVPVIGNSLPLHHVSARKKILP